MSPYLAEPRDLYHGRALCVLKPRTPQEVAGVLALCNESGASVTPQGGNTGLVGGQTPDPSGASVVLSLERLNRIRAVDATTDAMTVEAGVTLSQAQDAAQAADRYFPLSLASEGSCTIGGNLATNAGGVHVLAYGSMRDLVLGVEVALADGRLLSTLGALRKDNTGYDLTRLFVGSEGTLGVITAATLKLFPLPALPRRRVSRAPRSGSGAVAPELRQRPRGSDAQRLRTRVAVRASNSFCVTFPERAILWRSRTTGMR